MNSKKKLISNCVIIAIIIAMGASMVFTVNAAKSSVMGNMSQPGQYMQKGDGQQPPDMPGSDNQQGDQSNQQGGPGSGNGEQHMQKGDGQQPPDMPGGDNQQGGQDNENGKQGDQGSENGEQHMQKGDGQQPPDMPGSGNGEQHMQKGDGQQPPEMPDGDNQQGDQSNQQGDQDSEKGKQGGPGKGGMQAPPDMQKQSISGKYYALFGAEALVMALMIAYLICSGANSRTIEETFRGSKRKAAFIIAAVILAGGITAADIAIASNHSDDGMPAQMQQMEADENSKADDAQGATVVDGEEQTLSESYNTSEGDTSAILVKNGGSMTLDGGTVTKTGDSTNTGDSEFYGINAGILTTSGSTSTIKGSTITTDDGGSNAVFAT